MKKIWVLCLVIMSSAAVFAQQTAKNDVILKLNGEELNGKVLKINDNDIEFAYAGETLSYTIKKSDIMKITYSSGRIEVFTKQPLPSETKSQPATTSGKDGPGLEEHHNKVAVLPFTFVRDGQAADDAISEQVQNECYSFMSKHAGIFNVLPPRTTNALLIKAGVNKETVKGYTMDDLCNILGVEYVVEGIVNMNKTTQTTSLSNTGSSTTKDDNKGDNNKDKKYNNYSYGTSTQNFQTKLTLNMYNDKGTSVYAQDRTSFWNTQDAYISTLEYLLKRSPLYTK